MIFTIVLLMILLMIAFPLKSYAKSNPYIESVDIGEPIENCQPIDSILGTVEGEDFLYSSPKGLPAIFNIYNLSKRKFIKSYTLSDSKSPWTHVKDSKGNIYVAGEGYVYRYDPFTDQFEELGRCLPTETASFVMTVGKDDNIYIGTFPNAKIVRYDPIKKQFTDLGTMEQGANYVRSITYYDGWLYCGTFGNRSPKFIRIDPENPKNKKSYPLPYSINSNPIEWLYTMNQAGGYILIFAKTKTATSLLIFDPRTETFINTGFTKKYNGLYTTDEKDGISYFIAEDQFYQIDFRQNCRISKTGIVVPCGTMLRGGGWLTGESNTYCTVSPDDSSIALYHMDTKKVQKISNHGQTAGKVELQAIENGPGDEIYIGGFMGSIGSRYHVNNGNFTSFPIDQTEGMVAYKGKMYFGVYPGGRLYEYDPASAESPKLLCHIGDNQDRPFAMEAADNKLFLGTIPNYGELGGALSIYDIKAKTIENFRNIIKNQSVISLAIKGKTIYGSTSVFGGLGAAPSEATAMIFSFDIENRTKTEEFTPQIPGIDKPLWIGAISFDKNGFLWGVSGKTLFALDTNSKKIVRYKSFGESQFPRQKHRWRPVYIRWDDNGRLYVNIDGIKIVEPSTMECIDLKQVTGKVDLFTLGTDENIYFGSGSHFKMIKQPIK